MASHSGESLELPHSDASVDADQDYTNQMALDSSDDYVIEPPDVETDDVAVITPESINAKEIRADDEAAMKDLVLSTHPLVEQPPVLDEQWHTWNITGWRSLQKKEHGPVFEAGGYPWSVNLEGAISKECTC